MMGQACLGSEALSTFSQLLRRPVRARDHGDAGGRRPLSPSLPLPSALEQGHHPLDDLAFAYFVNKIATVARRLKVKHIMV